MRKTAAPHRHVSNNEYAAYLVHGAMTRPWAALRNALSAAIAIAGARYTLGWLLCRTDACWPAADLWGIVLACSIALACPAIMALAAIQYPQEDLHEFLRQRRAGP
jgi:hypothetical protein